MCFLPLVSAGSGSATGLCFCSRGRGRAAPRRIDVRPRPKKDDSVEVYVGEEFLGLIYLDDEDGDRSYNFQMAILDVDLDEVN